jgi:hypothetical protein
MRGLDPDALMVIAKRAHQIGTIVFGVSLWGFGSWLWQAVRQQQNFFEDGKLSRLDILFSQSFLILFSALALAAGMGLRLIARYLHAKSQAG